MDWNIFFSTASQTSGAIVGIFAAFLITKIVANQSEFSRDREKAIDATLKSEALQHESATRRFVWYNKHTSEQAFKKLEQLLEAKDASLSPEDYIDRLGFSMFQSRSDVLLNLNKKITEITNRIVNERAEAHYQQFGSIYVRQQNPLKYMKTAYDYNIENQLNEERQFISDLLVRVSLQMKYNVEILKNLKSSSDSAGLVSIAIIAVILLFFVGVIWPLSFLPLAPNSQVLISLSAFWEILFSIKGLLLFLMSIIFCGLMFAFLYINQNLKFENKIVEGLKFYCDVGSYSKYFKIYYENQEEETKAKPSGNAH